MLKAIVALFVLLLIWKLFGFLVLLMGVAVVVGALVWVVKNHFKDHPLVRKFL